MKYFLTNLLVICFFIVFAQDNLQVYYGNLHSHTGFSDGVMTPAYAYKYARDTAGLDFLAVTDHCELLTPAEYTEIQHAADSFTVANEFTGIFGFEWTSPYYGHCDVFQSPSLPDQDYLYDWAGFTQWVLSVPAARAQFNHPGRSSSFNNWNSFDYAGTTVDSVFSLLEFQSIEQATDFYEFSLNKGWHLSPAFNQDNHSANWGTMNNNRTGIWAHRLSRANLFQAIDSGRTFATMDKNAAIWISIDQTPMGSSLQRFYNMSLNIRISDADLEAWVLVELVSSQGVIESFSSWTDIDTTINLTLFNDKYVFVRAIQADGNRIWSAPIYLRGVLSGIEHTQEFPFTISPNPANDYFVIQAQKKQIGFSVEIYTLQGRKLNQKSEKTGDLSQKIYTPNLAPGMYLLKISAGNFQYAKMIHVE
ncbi:MAG: hypothetical protein CVU05_08075 [Bacteroidetes bacterium HGW-Bacteroidetes-21]|nr:MAG: hypothetical protein CVU05_08075 [Bacteroidetes bacterium HGW-Bacteroidetes-21]